MKRKTFIYILIPALVVIGTVTFLLFREYKDRSGEGDSDNKQEVSEIDTTNWKTYTYDFEGLDPSFSFKYPNGWDEAMCDAGGCWNINLTNGSRELLIDLSGQGNSSFDESLNDWINVWGSYNIEYVSGIIEEGTLINGDRSYVIYKVTEEDSESPYIIAIVNIGESEYGIWRFAVKASDINDLDYVKKILLSIL